MRPLYWVLLGSSKGLGLGLFGIPRTKIIQRICDHYTGFYLGFYVRVQDFRVDLVGNEGLPRHEFLLGNIALGTILNYKRDLYCGY